VALSRSTFAYLRPSISPRLIPVVLAACGSFRGTHGEGIVIVAKPGLRVKASIEIYYHTGSGIGVEVI
jgi:hypothetical protein